MVNHPSMFSQGGSTMNVTKSGAVAFNVSSSAHKSDGT